MNRNSLTGPEWVFGGIIIVASIPLMAWTMACLWGWFVAEPFGIKAISAAHAFGLAMLIRVATWRGNYPKSDVSTETRSEKWAVIWRSLAEPLFPLIIGWLLHLWMIR